MDEAYTRLQNFENNLSVTYDTIVLASTYGRG